MSGSVRLQWLQSGFHQYRPDGYQKVRQLGPVAYGSSDLSHPIASYQQQTQVAVGGLFGYDFGPLTLQAYATTDVVEHNYGGRDTRGWFRMVIPLWTPPTLPQITK